MDKKHIIDGTGPRSADVLVCGFSEPPGSEFQLPRSADILVCGFSELSGSEFPPPVAAASLVIATN
jgi:hypothetical protein